MTAMGRLPAGIIERAVRAILFLDVVESVRLIERDEEHTISRWLAMVEYVEQSIMPDTGGRIVKRLGDGLLLEFVDVRDTATAAFAIQAESARDNADIPPDGH